MISNDESGQTPPIRGQWFTTTPWGIVVTASQNNSPEAAGALEKLCAAYWYPLYAYVRRRGHKPHDAQDLVQEFFARFLAKNYLQTISADRGKFRSFLLACLNHFLSNERDRAQALKRGGGQAVISLDDQTAEERYQLEPAAELTAAMIFERRWALAVLDQALQQLRNEYATSGREAQFERLKGFLEGDVGRGGYHAPAAELGVTPGAVAMAVQRLRLRYRDLVRLEVARTLVHPSELESEMRHLFAVLAR